MYRLGRKGHAKVKKRTWRVTASILTVVLVGGGIATYFIIRGLEQEPTVPQAITREFSDSRDNTDRTFTQAGFTISLPSDWVVREEGTGVHGRHSWQATAKHADNRWLDVYVDDIPTNIAFNRLLPVTTASGKIIVSGSISDNCSTFGTTGVTPESSRESTVVAKWQDIEFLCDMANYTRNVVGVGTTDSQNRVMLISASGRQHTFLFVYTDHNVHPNYQILENALKSVTLE